MQAASWLAILLALIVCSPAGTGVRVTDAAEPIRQPGVDRQPYGRMPDGTVVERFTLTSATGMEVRAITYGAIITAIRVPDRSGALADVVHGFDDLDGYLAPHPYFGAIVGRYANRIARGRFTLDGRTYTLAVNNGANHLHGGHRGFDKVVWEAGLLPGGEAGVRFSRTSPDDEEGYPGTLTVHVTYRLTEAGELRVQYEAGTDRPTPVNLSQHTYFNLGGHGAGTILDHELTIHARHYTPVDEGLIPTGEIAPVDGTPFDFRKPTPIGARIDQADVQLARGKGYDHNFVLDRAAAGLQPAARLVHRPSGRTLDVRTTEPGLQLYTGNFLDGSHTGKGGVRYRHRSGLCLETQHFPDSPNRPQFPSTILRPGERYQSETVFAFGVIR